MASNLKVPLTPIEQAIQLSPGPAHGAAAVRNLRPFALAGTRARLGIATSLPAFVYGAPTAGLNPCSDTAAYYMRCLDRLGANVVIQDDANPGAWTGPAATGSRGGSRSPGWAPPTGRLPIRPSTSPTTSPR
ncbi:MAG TPA: hypothetical protein VLP43_08680 [Solirubrobacteraceae bacterium]|nr:hypothetical protein [Solirubrobacteraceae bacterium]